MTGMRWGYVDADQCKEKVSVITCHHQAAIKLAVNALAQCLCGPLKGGLL